jgi:hypothetical protein
VLFRLLFLLICAAVASAPASPLDGALERILQRQPVQSLDSVQAALLVTPNHPVLVTLRASLETDAQRSADLCRAALRHGVGGAHVPIALLGLADNCYVRGDISETLELAGRIVTEYSRAKEAPWATVLVARCHLWEGAPVLAAKQTELLLKYADPDVRLAATATWVEALFAQNRRSEVVVRLTRRTPETTAYEFGLLARAERGLLYARSADATGETQKRLERELDSAVMVTVDGG